MISAQGKYPGFTIIWCMKFATLISPVLYLNYIMVVYIFLSVLIQLSLPHKLFNSVHNFKNVALFFSDNSNNQILNFPNLKKKLNYPICGTPFLTFFYGLRFYTVSQFIGAKSMPKSISIRRANTFGNPEVSQTHLKISTIL